VLSVWGACVSKPKGKRSVASQHTNNMSAEPNKAYIRPPHWYNKPESKVPTKRPNALAA
jgi:hypothetical protein